MSRRLPGLVFILYFAFFCLSTSAFAQQGTISTVVGADWVFSGANGPATQASLGQPQAVTLDSAGNVYVADSGNHMVFKIDGAGVLTIVAGTGAAGFSGDSGLATAARLNFPSDVAIDTAGNLYVTDTGNCRVRKINASGIIATIAGSGTCGYDGDSGQAVNAQLSRMYGVAVDSTANRLYIADTGNHVVRAVDLGSGIITTVAGTGTFGYNGDNQAATAAQLDTPTRAIPFGTTLYIAEFARVRAVIGGTITTVAGTGTAGYNGDNQLATLAQLNYVWGLAVDGAGQLFIADGGNNRLRMVNTSGIITTIAGTGQPGFSGDGALAVNARVNFPQSPWVGTAGIFFADTANMRVRRIALDGTISTIGGNGVFRFGGDDGPAVDAFLYNPLQIGAITNALIIADAGNRRLRKVDANSLTITTIAGDGVYADRGDGGSALQASFMLPFGVVGDDFGNIWVSDRDASRVRKIDTSGNISAVAGTGVSGYNGDGTPATNYQLNQPYGLAGMGTSQLYIADRFNQRIRMVTSGGTISTVAGNGQTTYNGDNQPAISAALNNPSSVAFDSVGNMYIAERNGHRVRKVATNGTITTFAGTGVAGFSGDGGPATAAQLSTPGTVAVDAHNNVYIADWSNARIRVVNTDGNIATLTGTGTPGFSGDGGPAAMAAIGTSVAGMIFDNADNLYFSDSGNNRIRKIEGAAAPGFVLVVSPASQTAGLWQQATYSVKMVPFSGFSSTVVLSCGGPPGLSCAFAPSSTISPGATVTLQVTVGPSAPRGTFSFTVVGTFGAVTNSASASITVASGCGGASKTWIGGTSGAWETATNWSGGVLPTSSDTVCLAGGFGVDISGSATAGGLYSDGTLNITATGTLDVAGTGSGESWVKDVYLYGTLSGTGPIRVGRSMQWTSGTMSGASTTEIMAGAFLYITGSADKYLRGRNLKNLGTIAWIDNGAIHADQGAVINNMALSVFSAQNNSGFVSDGGSVAFNNYGDFIKSGAGTTTTFGANTSFYNYGGQVEIAEGLLQLASFTQNAGLLLMTGGNLTVPSLTLSGGYLQGSGTITGNVTNGALVVPGVLANALSIVGNYTQTSTGNMTIDVGMPPVQKLAVSGAASLAGSLTVAASGYTPFPGDTFNVMTYGSVTGSFSIFNSTVGFARVYGPFVLSLVYSGPSGTTCTYLVSGPVSWWKGDGNGANAAGGPAASLLGGVGFYSGPLGTAFSLNGTSAYLSVPDSPLWAFGQTDLSIALWVAFNSLPSNHSLQFPDAVFAGNNEGSGNLNKWVFGLGNGNLFFHTNSSSAGPRYFAQTPFSPVLGRWYHLAVTRKVGHGYGMYVNGVLLTSEMNFDPVPDAAAPLTIGQTEGLGFLNGYLNQVQIYRRTLASTEVAELYDAGSYGLCPGAYNPSLDFSSGANPNGFWSYGYSNALGGPFTPLTVPISMATGLAGFSQGGARPSIQGNSTDSPITYSNTTVPPQGLELHPGPDGEYAIVRWTAPLAGVYAANGFFGSLSSTGATTDVHVRVRNDMRFDSTVSGNNTGFGLSFAMNAGDTLDFLVGWGSNATNLNDSTQLSLDIANISASHPGPSISTLSPSIAAAGSAAFTLTVNGANFEPGTVVRWNGSDRATTFADAGHLTAQILAGDIATPGLYDVTVYTPGVSGSGPSTFTVTGGGTCVSVASGIAGLWKGEGNANDSWGANNGTAVGGVTYVTGLSGQAFSFNGTTGYVTVPDSPALRPSSVTVTGWFKLNSAPTAPVMILSKPAGTAQYNSYALYLSASSLVAVVGSASGSAGGASYPFAFTPGVWYHVAYAFDSVAQTQALYLNGAAVFSGALSATLGYDAHPILIGVDSDFEAPVGFFPGQLDELAVFNRALSAGEITAVYAAGSAGICGASPNPLPVVYSLSPASIPAGTPGITLNVTGSGFVPGAAVLWNGSTRPTTFVSDTQLQATISSGDLLAGGAIPITVQNPAPGGGVSPWVMFYITAYARGLNLLVNPGAEGGPVAATGTESVFVPGWTLSGPLTVVAYGTTGAPHGDFISPTDPGPSVRGTRFFAGGANASTSNAIQVIDISSDASAIDAGQVAYYLGGYLGGLSTQGDSSQLSATFKDASGYPLAGVILGPVTPADRSSLTGLLARSRAGLVPAGTRKVQVTLLMNLAADSYIDGYADSLVFGVHSAYVVGDSFPYETSSAGAFGDAKLDNVDLIQAFRAATNPALKPPTCSDRFDAMDAYPLDNSNQVGGDGAIDNMDLIAILDRVVRLDTSTPVRPGMIAGSDRDARCTGRAAPELMARPSEGTAEWTGGASLEFGGPVAQPDNVWRVPVYLRAPADLDLIGFSMSLGVPGFEEGLRFIPAEAGPPSLVDAALPGQVAAGWLSGLRLETGQRMLLGFVEVSGLPQARALRVNGVVANRRSDKRLVPIGTPAQRDQF